MTVSKQRQTFLACGFLVGLGLVTYWPAVTSPTLFGDEWAGLAAITHGQLACPERRNVFLRPLLGCYYAASAAVGGSSVVTHQWVSLSLYLLVGCMLYLLWRQLAPSNQHVGLCAAALFVAHSSAFPIVFFERGYQNLALAVLLVGLLIQHGALLRGSCWRIGAALVLYACSLLLYEAHVGLLMLASVCYALGDRHAPPKRRLAHLAPLVLGVAFSVGRMIAQAIHDGAFGHSVETISLAPLDILHRLYLGLRILFQWSWTNALAQYVPYRSYPWAALLAGVVFIGGALWIAARRYRRSSGWKAFLPGAPERRELLGLLALGAAVCVAGYFP